MNLLYVEAHFDALLSAVAIVVAISDHTKIITTTSEVIFYRSISFAFLYCRHRCIVVNSYWFTNPSPCLYTCLDVPDTFPIINISIAILFQISVAHNFDILHSVLLNVFFPTVFIWPQPNNYLLSIKSLLDLLTDISFFSF